MYIYITKISLKAGLSFPGLKRTRGKGIKNRSFGHFAEKKEKEVFNIGLYCWLGQDHPPLPLALLGRQYNGDCFHHGTPHYGHYSSTALGGDCKFKLRNIRIEGASGRSRQMQHDATSNMSSAAKKQACAVQPP